MMLALEREKQAQGYRLVAGVDEAGRGPLAGPVVAASVIFDPDKPIPEGIDDSKKLSAKKRNLLEGQIKESALVFAVSVVSHITIDKINILQASLEAMLQAVNALSIQPDYCLFDGRHQPHLDIPGEPVIRGDSLSVSIAAASILAKEARDRLMVELDELYPQYGFSRHKGYPTQFHLQAIREHGLSPVHRRTFRAKKLMDSGIYDAMDQ